MAKVRFARFITPLVALSLCACSMLKDEYVEGKAEALNGKIQVVAIELANRIREFETTDKTIAVSTFVDLDNLEDTSAFGRYVAEELSTELYKLGFRLRELRQMEQVDIVPEKGEFALSRKTAKLMKKFHLDAIVAGTYTMVGDEVVVNARMLSLDTARVVSVGQMTANVQRKGYVRGLLKRGSGRSAPTVRVYGPDEEG